MEQEYLSVKQLAGEIGTNKLTIHRAINKLGLQGKLHKAGNRYMLSESQAKQIKSIILGENVSGNVSIVSNEIVSNPSENVSNVSEIVSNVSEIVSSVPENVSNVSNKIVSNKIVSNEIVSETHETQSKHIENTDKTYQPNQDLQLSILDRQLAVKDNQIQMLQEQIKLLQQQLIAKDNQIGQITAAMENLTTALSAEQALHAGTIQKQLADHSVKEEIETEQPKQKQSFFSRIFGKRENGDKQ